MAPVSEHGFVQRPIQGFGLCFNKGPPSPRKSFPGRVCPREKKQGIPSSPAPAPLLPDVLPVAALTPAQIVNVTLAYAAADVYHEGLLRGITALACREPGFGVPEFELAEDIGLAWGVAQLNYRNDTLMETIAARIAAASSLTKYPDVAALANLSWAFANTGVAPVELFRQIADRMLFNSTLATLPPHSLAMLAWAFATSGIEHMQLMQQIAGRVKPLLQAFSASDLTQMAWAFSVMGSTDDSLLSALLFRILLLAAGTLDPQVQGGGGFREGRILRGKFRR